jgi:predicted acyl esterase
LNQRRLAPALLACAAVFLAAPAAASAVTVGSYSVPVTQPDEAGMSVSIDTDVYVPDGSPPPGGWPVVEIFHGGGGSKSGGFEVTRANELAAHGYASILYSARGHGSSGGQVTAFGPKEIRDLFDVTAWAFGVRDQPPHPDFGLDRSRIAAFGESQGGLHTNLGEVYEDDPGIDPYGFDFKVLLPGNTPDYVFNALVQNGAVKLSFGVGLIETYIVGAHGQVSPLLGKWIAALASDQPSLTGGQLCDASTHDTPTSTTKQDLAVRSPGCFAEQMTAPSLWSQAFDDGLFTADMGISMWRRMPNPENRLYLTMGGHGAPSRTHAAERDQLDEQIVFLDRSLKPGSSSSGGGASPTTLRVRGGKRARCHKRHHHRHRCRKHRRKGSARAGAARAGRDDLPEVVYWRREPRVAVPSDAYAYPEDAWTRHTSPGWPPPGTTDNVLQLSADGAAEPSGATTGTMPLAPFSTDPGNDQVISAALSATPAGTSPVPAQVPLSSAPGYVAAFATAPFGADRELSGQVTASLAWTPLSPDTQLVVKLFDRAPDGTATLLTRGVTGIRGATPAVQQQVAVPTNTMSSLIPAGHSLLAWVSASELSFYKTYFGSLGGALAAGPGSTLTVPLRTP